MTKSIIPAGWTAGLLLAAASWAQAQTPLGTAFTYQGRLSDGGAPAGGAYDLQLALFDAASAGAQVGATLTRDDVAVTSGLFTVGLDFGPVFSGSRRWLEIGVRPGASTGPYDILSPRQELTPAPNAVFSASVPWTGIAGKPPGFADDVDDDSGGDITAVTAGAGLSGGGGGGAVSLAVDPALVQSRVTGVCAAGSSIRTVNQDGSVACQPDTTGADWSLSGNAGTVSGTNFLGTTDDVPLELRVNGQRALRLERVTTTVGGATYAGDNIIGGDAGNSLTAGVTLATIAGGGGTIGSVGYPNRVSDFGGTVGGGVGNHAGNSAGSLEDAVYATVAGGYSNAASGGYSAIAGGSGNTASGFHAVISGGQSNTSSANSSVVTGGFGNAASAGYAAVAGGQANVASGGYAVVAGGVSNTASGMYSVVAGGVSNTAGAACSPRTARGSAPGSRSRRPAARCSPGGSTSWERRPGPSSEPPLPSPMRRPPKPTSRPCHRTATAPLRR